MLVALCAIVLMTFVLTGVVDQWLDLVEAFGSWALLFLIYPLFILIASRL